MQLEDDELADLIAASVKVAVAPWVARVEMLEKRAVVNGINGKDGMCGPMGPMGPAGDCGPMGPAGERGEMGPQGAQGDAGDMGPMGPQGSAGDCGPQGEKGEKGDRGDVGPMGPAGKDGLDGIQGKDGAAGRDGVDGKSLTADDVRPLIDAAITKAMGAIVFPKDGLDGKGIADAVIDQDGLLMLTYTDGTTKAVGKVQGKAGRDGMPGVPGRPGDDGKDGQDGLGFNDIAVEYDGERRFAFKFLRGDREKAFGAFAAPFPIDRGVWKDGQSYERGDSVSFGGSSFTAQRQTSAKPETNDDWRLAVKRGRDGKDGKGAK